MSYCDMSYEERKKLIEDEIDVILSDEWVDEWHKVPNVAYALSLLTEEIARAWLARIVASKLGYYELSDKTTYKPVSLAFISRAWLEMNADKLANVPYEEKFSYYLHNMTNELYKAVELFDLITTNVVEDNFGLSDRDIEQLRKDRWFEQ